MQESLQVVRRLRLNADFWSASSQADLVAAFIDECDDGRSAELSFEWMSSDVELTGRSSELDDVLLSVDVKGGGGVEGQKMRHSVDEQVPGRSGKVYAMGGSASLDHGSVVDEHHFVRLAFDEDAVVGGHVEFRRLAVLVHLKKLKFMENAGRIRLFHFFQLEINFSNIFLRKLENPKIFKKFFFEIYEFIFSNDFIIFRLKQII